VALGRAERPARLAGFLESSPFLDVDGCIGRARALI
jgi:hypothetical protein